MPALATLELSRRVIRTLTPRQRWLGLERDAVLEAPMRCHPVDFGSAAPHQRVRTRIVLVAAPWMWSDKTFGASSNDAILVTDLGRIPRQLASRSRSSRLDQPKVNAIPSAPDARNSISNTRSTIALVAGSAGTSAVRSASRTRPHRRRLRVPGPAAPHRRSPGSRWDARDHTDP